MPPIHIPNWAALPDDVTSTIAGLLEGLSEFISFRGTCTSWRLATKDFQKEWCPGLPFLMINRVRDNPDGGDNNNNRDVFNFYKGKVSPISISEIKDKLFIGTKGWLITIDSSCDMSLLNPITRAEIHLPKMADCWVKRGVLSASPTKTCDFVVMVVYLKYPKQANFLAFWKPGNPSWTQIKTSNSLTRGIRDVIFLDGMFYVLSYARRIWKLDVSDPDPIIPIQLMDLPGDVMYIGSYSEAFFVVCGGTLLVVSSRYLLHLDCSPHRVLQLIELDLINGTCKKIKNLGGNSVFIGNSEGLCVDATRFSGLIRPNCIYQSNGSYQIAGCEDMRDISPVEKAGMFCSDTHSNPTAINISNAFILRELF